MSVFFRFLMERKAKMGDQLQLLFALGTLGHHISLFHIGIVDGQAAVFLRLGSGFRHQYVGEGKRGQYKEKSQRSTLDQHSPPTCPSFHAVTPGVRVLICFRKPGSNFITYFIAGKYIIICGL